MLMLISSPPGPSVNPHLAPPTDTQRLRRRPPRLLRRLGQCARRPTRARRRLRRRSHRRGRCARIFERAPPRARQLAARAPAQHVQPHSLHHQLVHDRVLRGGRRLAHVDEVARRGAAARGVPGFGGRSGGSSSGVRQRRGGVVDDDLYDCATRAAGRWRRALGRCAARRAVQCVIHARRGLNACRRGRYGGRMGKKNTVKCFGWGFRAFFCSYTRPSRILTCFINMRLFSCSDRRWY